MSKEKLGSEPAFPALEHNESGYGDQITLYFEGQRQFIPFTKGMSKRFYVACAAMQGLLANPNRELRYDRIEEFIKDCYDHADELLKQENE